MQLAFKLNYGFYFMAGMKSMERMDKPKRNDREKVDSWQLAQDIEDRFSIPGQ